MIRRKYKIEMIKVTQYQVLTLLYMLEYLVLFKGIKSNTNTTIQFDRFLLTIQTLYLAEQDFMMI